MKKRNAELCAMSAKDPNHFWQAFKAPSHNSCPVELSAQFEAFRALMGAQLAQGTGSPPPSGVSDLCTPGAACLNAHITAAELRDCIKRLKRGKSPGVDGILAEMIKDGGDLLETCLLWLFNCMLASHFPERLSVGLITAVYKSGDNLT